MALPNRATTFDALAYAAANADLVAAFGTDEEALSQHYLYGYAEGRPIGRESVTVAALPTASDATVHATAFVDAATGHGGASTGHGDGLPFTGPAWNDMMPANHPGHDVLVIA